MDAFRSDKVLPNILKRLLNQDVVHRYKLDEVQARNHTLYRADVPATSFVLILEGHLEVEVGRDKLKFEAGPFDHFGMQALETAGESDYVPDFTVRPLTDCLLLVITCTQYLDARKATMFQKTKEQGSLSSLGNNHCTVSTSPTSVRVSSVSPRPCKSPTPLKTNTTKVTTKKQWKSKSGSKLEAQPLLPGSLSEEEEGDSDDAAVTRLLPVGASSAARSSSSPAMLADVEMHSYATSTATAQTNGPPQVSVDEDPPPALDSSQL